MYCNLLNPKLAHKNNYWTDFIQICTRPTQVVILKINFIFGLIFPKIFISVNFFNRVVYAFYICLISKSGFKVETPTSKPGILTLKQWKWFRRIWKEGDGNVHKDLKDTCEKVCLTVSSIFWFFCILLFIHYNYR